MPQWIYERPVDKCNEHELSVAKWLEKLPDGYVIRWGFYYKDNNQTEREGDFLILGPDGHLMVLEVKKRVYVDANTGKSTGKEADSPVFQLLSEKDAVLTALTDLGKTDRQKYFLPYIVPVLAGCENTQADLKPAGLDPRQVWFDVENWANPESKWQKVFADARACKSPEAARCLFLDCYGGNVGGKSAGRALAQTDRQLLIQATREYDLLDHLEDNRVLLVRGGPGSGKSWIAIESAIREAKAGKDVLFLCYNLDFSSESAKTFMKRAGQIGPGTIKVWSWHELVKQIAQQASLPLAEPTDAGELKHYYAETVPQAMADAATSGKVTGQFGSLVVDEAQDHDTTSSLGISWWEIYLSLLRSPNSARVLVFFDPFQRPAFRDNDKAKFEVEELERTFPGAVRVRLKKTRRYTDSLASFLHSLNTPSTVHLANGIQAGHDFPGPEPIVEISDSFQEARFAATACVERWIKEAGVKLQDILILTKSRPFEGENPPLDSGQEIAGYPLIAINEFESTTPPQAIRCTSFHKSKGLDAQAVVMLGTWPFENLSGDDQFAYWMAASRARQLLAIFPHRKKTVPK